MHKWKPDVIHIHWQHPFIVGRNILDSILRSLIFVTGLVLLKLLGVRIVWTVHNLHSHERKFISLELFFTSILARLADRIIVHCNFAKYLVGRAFKISNETCITVIPHGNYSSAYENKLARNEARRLLNVPLDNIVFLYFGLIRPYKGVLQLIRAFKQIEDGKARLFIVGKPANNIIARRLIEESRGDPRIRVIPRFIPSNEVQLYMNTADIAVLPYEEILTSGSILLAMSFCKPVIVPRLGCIPEILDKKGGILYNPSDPNGLLEALKTAVAMGMDLSRMGRYNCMKAKNLDWSILGLYTYKVYIESLQD